MFFHCWWINEMCFGCFVLCIFKNYHLIFTQLYTDRFQLSFLLSQSLERMWMSIAKKSKENSFTFPNVLLQKKSREREESFGLTFVVNFSWKVINVLCATKQHNKGRNVEIKNEFLECGKTKEKDMTGEKHFAPFSFFSCQHSSILGNLLVFFPLIRLIFTSCFMSKEWERLFQGADLF